jgi:hypothetical protein
MLKATLTSGIWIEIQAGTVRVGTIDPVGIQTVIDSLRSHGIPIRRVQAVKPSLEDLYMEAVIDPTTGRAAAAGARLARPGFPVVTSN